MKSSVRWTILVVVIGACVAAFLLKPTSDRTSGEPAVAEKVALPRLVDLGSDQCVPCKMMAPILDGLEKEYAGSFIVEVIDVRKDQQAGEEYGIRVIPTQIFYDRAGVEQFRHEGFLSKEAILGKWAELGVDLVALPVDADR